MNEILGERETPAQLPALTAKERASAMFEARGYNHPSEIPIRVPNPRDEMKPLSVIEPSFEQIEKRAMVNGRDYEKAKSEVVTEFKAQLSRLAKISPDHANRISDKIADARRLNDEAASDINEVTTNLGAVEQLIRERAELRSKKAQTENELAGIVAQLDDPASLDLSEDAIISLTHKRRHLPTPITALEADIVDITARLKETAKASDIDLHAVTQALYEESGMDNGFRYFRDPVFKRLHEAGWTACE